MSPSRQFSREEEDSARRMADAVNLHVLAVQAEGAGRDRPGFVAIRLSDGAGLGGQNGSVLYDTRADAVRHHKHDGGVFYVKIGRDTMPATEALYVLQLARQAYKRGVIFAEEEQIAPQLMELVGGYIPRTLRGIRDAQSN